MLKITAPVVKHSAFRQRVFQRPDGVIELVIGDSAQPTEWTLLADHDVDQVSTVTEHVEPIPAPAAGA